MSTPFSDLPIRIDLQRGLKGCGYEVCTPIQEMAIPVLLKGSDLLGMAQTGTGKTLAFLIPILEQLRANSNVQALVVCPTRELALQVGEEAKRLSPCVGASAAVLYGGTSLGPQRALLREGAQIVVGTPGRLLDFMQSAYLPTRDIRFVVLDEADRMLDMGFIRDIQSIMKRCPLRRQTMLFSATFPDEIRRLASDFMLYPEEVSIEPERATARGIRQRAFLVRRSDKQDLLRQLLVRDGSERILVFCSTREATAEVARGLSRGGIRSGSISSLLSQANREATLEMFRDGTLRVLVASDVASRGLDIDDITHVYNFDLPQTPEDYVHRIGRTARLEKKGEAVTFVEPGQMDRLAEIEKHVHAPMERAEMAGFSHPEGEDRSARRGRRRPRPKRR